MIISIIGCKPRKKKKLMLKYNNALSVYDYDILILNNIFKDPYDEERK